MDWRPTTTFREIRASVAAQGGLGPKAVAKQDDHEKVAEGVEYRGDEES